MPIMGEVEIFKIIEPSNKHVQVYQVFRDSFWSKQEGECLCWVLVTAGSILHEVCEVLVAI